MLDRTLRLFTASTGIVALAACAPPASSTRTTSADKYAAGSPSLRTVDNAGYVDPGGRTGQVSAGGTTTTGRGAATVPPPRREDPTGSASAPASEAPADGAPGIAASSSADPTELRERASRALCDREAYCDRVGAGKTFESADACMVSKRERVRAAMNEAACEAIRGEAVSRCLNAIRAAECGQPGVPLPPPAACTADTLCK